MRAFPVRRRLHGVRRPLGDHWWPALIAGAALIILIIDPDMTWGYADSLSLTKRLTPTELALPNFLTRFEQKKAGQFTPTGLAELKPDPWLAWGGSDALWVDDQPQVSARQRLASQAARLRSSDLSSEPSNATWRVSSRYGYRVLGGYSAHHDGIDLAAPQGTPIRATAPGVASYVGWRSGYGQTVILDHEDGRQTLYAHASRLNVAVGQHVQTGQIIARVGNTGRSFGAHLHYEVRVNGLPIDPETTDLSPATALAGTREAE